MTAYTLTPSTLSLVLDGEVFNYNRDNAIAKRLIGLLREGHDAPDILRETMNPLQGVRQYMGSVFEFNSARDVRCNGIVLPEVLCRRIWEHCEAQAPVEYLLAFFKRLDLSTSRRAIQELFGFLENRNMPITPRGTFLGYKGVQNDYFSRHGNLATRVIRGMVNEKGQIHNPVGAYIQVDVRDVCDDARNGCAEGLHVGSLGYARTWSDRVVIVEVDPKHVVSVPFNEHQKLRVSEYLVVSDYKEPLPETTVDDAMNPYANRAPTLD